jgi:hypothetical protein
MGLLHSILVYSPVNEGDFIPRAVLVLMYLGPESIMPLASILAAVIGFLLIFWRSIFNFFKKIFKRNKPEEIETQPEASESEPYIDPLDKSG